MKKLKEHLENNLIGFKFDFAGEILPNWRNGTLALNDFTIECGSVDNDNVDIPEDVPLSENYTRFRVQVDRLELKLSLKRFLAGRGWIEEAMIDGARGIVDKRFVRWIEGWRWKPHQNELNTERLQLRNVHLNVIQARGYAPYSLTVIQASLPRLRLPWLFYDILNADGAHGIFDGHSLFSLHSLPPQQQHRNKNLKHFRMLGLDVKHLAAGADSASPLHWVTRGSVDIEAFLQLPLENESDESQDGSLVDSFRERILESSLVDSFRERVLESSLDLFQERCDDTLDLLKTESKQLTTVDVQTEFTFRNLRARQPTPKEFADALGHSSRLKMALLRPVLGYLNEHRPEIPLTCTLSLQKSQFEGVWGGWESGLFGGVAGGLDEAFRALVWDPEKRMKRIGRIGRYTLQALLQNKPLLSVD